MTSCCLLSLLQLRRLLKPERLVTLHSDEEDKLKIQKLVMFFIVFILPDCMFYILHIHIHYRNSAPVNFYSTHRCTVLANNYYIRRIYSLNVLMSVT